MGLVISTSGVIQSSEPRQVISQIKPDVLALLDVRYYLREYAVGSSFGPCTVHGNDLQEYRHLRPGTNENNPYPPKIASDKSLRFDGSSTLRTDVFKTIEIEQTIAMVLKIDVDSVGGMFIRIADNKDATKSKNILYSVKSNSIRLRAGIIDLITIPIDAVNLSTYIPIIVSFSKDKSIMVLGNQVIAEGPAAPLATNYFQLMSSDHATDKVTGNLKYFSWYTGAATEEEMLKLQQILKQNFNL